MQITLKGNPVDLEGVQPKVGDKAPNFSLQNLNDEVIELSSRLNQPLIISVVPDIDTSVCALQTKRFNQEAATETGLNFLTISNNSKEEQSNWCAAEGVEITMLRDADLEFAKNYGLLIPAINRLARAIFVVDTTGTIVYEEITQEVSQEPDYPKALEAAKALI